MNSELQPLHWLKKVTDPLNHWLNQSWLQVESWVYDYKNNMNKYLLYLVVVLVLVQLQHQVQTNY